MILAILLARMPRLRLPISTGELGSPESKFHSASAIEMSAHPDSEKVAPKSDVPNQAMVEKKENEDSGASSPAQASSNYIPEQDGSPTTFWSKVGHWMGNLPEWAVGGKKLAGKQLNFYIAFIASNGFLMFGYDQGVLSALITLRSWQEVFPLMTPREAPNDLCWIDGDRSNPDLNQCTGDANLQAFAIAIYQIGCFLGAVVILLYGERWGRKPSTFWGSLIMIIGEALYMGTGES
jgi:hypothetical protein